MASMDTQWALKSILQLGHHRIRHGAASVASSSSSSIETVASALQMSAMPRLMRACSHPSRVLLLARRPCGIAGVALHPGERRPWVGLTGAEAVKSRALNSVKARLLASAMQRHGFFMMPSSYPMAVHPAQPPILLHSNHLIGWKLSGGSPAFPMYAHTLTELQRLRSGDVATLQPQHCLFASEYCEWDNWREVCGEPGWDFFSGDDEVVERVVRHGLASPTLDEEDGLYKVEVL